MLPSHRLILSLGAALIGAAGPVPAAAQSAMQMIERLRPGTGGDRGLRAPGAEPTAPATPSAPPSAPAQAGSPPRPPAATVARPPLRPAEAPAATTAPAGTPAVSITVQFPTNSATLTPAAERALAPLGQALSSPELAPYRFRIEGHTDTVGPDEPNRVLSQRRAEAVRDFLTQRYNVPATRLEAAGLGESQPLVSTGDNRAEQRNRRVQVLNIGS
ncbi:OmpA family protein [Pararoseomonas sp. SCSIO 73927]|uniref:OmpA family protein n=1 Tax=Pararoseomonas sp. SCSIO 73927 TaxID=3114537 RepID=UPI0030CEA0CB